eukprot:Clim_evm47s240 gene=Clim_evmTU47s240
MKFFGEALFLMAAMSSLLDAVQAMPVRHRREADSLAGTNLNQIEIIDGSESEIDTIIRNHAAVGRTPASERGPLPRSGSPRLDDPRGPAVVGLAGIEDPADAAPVVGLAGIDDSADSSRRTKSRSAAPRLEPTSPPPVVGLAGIEDPADAARLLARRDSPRVGGIPAREDDTPGPAVVGIASIDPRGPRLADRGPAVVGLAGIDDSADSSRRRKSRYRGSRLDATRPAPAVGLANN